MTASTTIKGKLVADKNIKSMNFNIDVVNGIAYLSGIARTKKEAARFLGVDYMEFNRYIKKYNTISFFEETEKEVL